MDICLLRRARACGTQAGACYEVLRIDTTLYLDKPWLKVFDAYDRRTSKQERDISWKLRYLGGCYWILYGDSNTRTPQALHAKVMLSKPMLSRKPNQKLESLSG